MSKEDGYSKYTCDRCNRTEHAKAQTAAANSWHKINRRSKDGADQEWWYCSTCYPGYIEQASKSDDAFQAWMASAQEVDNG